MYAVLRPVRFRIFSFGFKLKTLDLPDDCSPVDCSATSDGWRISRYHPISIPEMLPMSDPTFEDYLDGIPEFERCQLLRYTLYDHTVSEVVHTLQQCDTYLLVSDRGADRKCGSYCWTLGCTDGRRLAQGWGSVFGFDPQSYRAEISGCRAGLLFLLHAFSYCSVSIPPGHLQVHCDNIGFIQAGGISGIQACSGLLLLGR